MTIEDVRKGAELCRDMDSLDVEISGLELSKSRGHTGRIESIKNTATNQEITRFVHDMINTRKDRIDKMKQDLEDI